MSDFRRLIIPADAAEQAELIAEGKSHLLFFVVFGGVFVIAAAVMLWPFKNIDSFHWMIFAVGQTLAVREWIKSGEYIEHTVDARRIAQLEKRTTK